MADRVFVVSWGHPVRGREERGVEVFNDAVGILGRMQQEGKLEGFQVVLLDPAGDINGYIAIEGSADQIAALRADDEFRTNTVDASLIVENLRHSEGVVNEGIAREMTRYTQAVSRVPQTA